MQFKEKSLYFSPYRVSTITCNADIGTNINIDMSIMYKYFEIKNEDNSFVWMQYLKEDESNFVGIYPKKQRKSKPNTKKKNRFDNQITVIYKYNSVYLPNIKIFKNGNIQLTGIKHFDHTEVIVNKIIEQIKNIYHNHDNNIILSSNDDPNPLNRLVYHNFKVRMINTDFKIYNDKEMTSRFSVKRRELHNILMNDEYNNKSSFQPGVYQGVKLEYFWNKSNRFDGICHCTVNCFGKHSGDGNGNCKKVTVAIFESGSILITGGITFEQVQDTYDYICKVISKNKQIINKQIFTELVI